jgi:hypothetical protein
MEVTKEKDTVRAALWAEIPATKELIDAHRMELRKVLGENGFRLERLDVFVQQGTDRFTEGKGYPFLGGQQEHADTKEDRAILSSESSEGPSIAARSYPKASNYINRII